MDMAGRHSVDPNHWIEDLSQLEARHIRDGNVIRVGFAFDIVVVKELNSEFPWKREARRNPLPPIIMFERRSFKAHRRFFDGGSNGSDPYYPLMNARMAYFHKDKIMEAMFGGDKSYFEDSIRREAALEIQRGAGVPESWRVVLDRRMREHLADDHYDEVERWQEADEHLRRVEAVWNALRRKTRRFEVYGVHRGSEKEPRSKVSGLMICDSRWMETGADFDSAADGAIKMLSEWVRDEVWGFMFFDCHNGIELDESALGIVGAENAIKTIREYAPDAKERSRLWERRFDLSKESWRRAAEEVDRVSKAEAPLARRLIECEEQRRRDRQAIVGNASLHWGKMSQKGA